MDPASFVFPGKTSATTNMVRRYGWGAKGERKTSVEQIKGVVRLCNEFGRKVATAQEARQIMKVGTWYDSVEETLRAADMPPNPTRFNPGFLTWPTDGKIKPAVLGGDSHPIAACMIAPEPVRKAQAAILGVQT